MKTYSITTISKIGAEVYQDVKVLDLDQDIRSEWEDALALAEEDCKIFDEVKVLMSSYDLIYEKVSDDPELWSSYTQKEEIVLEKTYSLISDELQ